VCIFRTEKVEKGKAPCYKPRYFQSPVERPNGTYGRAL
jgi:hypothetical protein